MPTGTELDTLVSRGKEYATPPGGVQAQGQAVGGSEVSSTYHCLHSLLKCDMITTGLQMSTKGSLHGCLSLQNHTV